MTQTVAVQRGAWTKLLCANGVEALTSAGVNLFMNGIAFYMTSQYRWSAKQVLLLMMVQGFAYTLGALSAGKFANRFSKRKTLLASQCILLVLLIPLSISISPWIVIPLLLASAMVSTLTWPLVESLVTEGCDPQQMSRRITAYNLTWSMTAASVIAIYGTILRFWPRGPMVLPVILQVFAVLLAVRLLLTDDGEQDSEPALHDPGVPHEELLHSRRLALWLARISLPASFVLVNTLMGMFASLRASTEMGVELSTVIAALWMASRVAMFLLLGTTDWWHTRPKLLFWAAVLLLVSFLAVVIPAERLGPCAGLSLHAIIAIMAIAELTMGLMAGFIFSASLYFGMVLSEGSTEQGGYHEGLIGVGMVLGPGLAAGAQQFAADGSRLPGIIAVTGAMVLTLIVAGWASCTIRPK